MNLFVVQRAADNRDNQHGAKQNQTGAKQGTDEKKTNEGQRGQRVAALAARGRQESFGWIGLNHTHTHTQFGARRGRAGQRSAGGYRAVPPPPKQLKQEKKPRLVPCRLLAAARLDLLTVGTPSEGGGLSNGGPDPSSHRQMRSAPGGQAARVRG